MSTSSSSGKFKSLAVKARSEVIVIDYRDAAADLIESLRQHERVVDQGIFDALSPELELIGQLLADEFPPVLVWNCLNSDLGKGILLGMLHESVANYYTMLEAKVDEVDTNDN